MFRTSGKVMLMGSMFLLLCLLAACDSANSSTGANANATGNNVTSIKVTTPTVVVAKSVQGSPGSGPIVVTSPTPVPGGSATSQQVILSDRTLVLNSVSKQDQNDGSSTLVTLVLTIKNTSDKPIPNQASFFQLVSSEGDTFTYQYNSSDTFYGDISAHSSRDGIIVFQIPKVAASHLQLLYRSEVATETVLMTLKM